jgi:hypothetical protein
MTRPHLRKERPPSFSVRLSPGTSISEGRPSEPVEGYEVEAFRAKLDISVSLRVVLSALRLWWDARESVTLRSPQRVADE